MSSVISKAVNGNLYPLEIEEEISGFNDQLVYEVVKLADCEYDAETETFYYLCPCGDVFELTLEDLLKGNFNAKLNLSGNLFSECPSCSLRIRIDLAPGELDQYLSLRSI